MPRSRHCNVPKAYIANAKLVFDVLRRYVNGISYSIKYSLQFFYRSKCIAERTRFSKIIRKVGKFQYWP